MAVTQSHFHFGIDSGTESTYSLYAAEDVNPANESIPLDTTFLLRFCLQCDATAANNQAPQFQYRVNGGTWTNITTSSLVARAVATAVYVDAANTTKRLSGTGTFETTSAGCTEDGLAGGTAMDIVSSGNAETVCSIQLRSADIVAGDLIEFRVVNTATPFTTYAVIPAYTPITASVPPLSVSVSETPRAREILAGAARGIVGAFLAAGLYEAPVKIAEELQASLHPPPQIQVSVYEKVRVREWVYGASRGVTGAFLSAGLMETVIHGTDGILSVLPVVQEENVKADDGGRVDLIGLGNPIRITDGPPAAELVIGAGNLSRNVVAEEFKVVDGPPLGALFPEGVSTALSESLKADDGGRVDLIGLGNPIRVTDGPVIAQIFSADMAVAVAVESLKVVDGPALRTLTPEQASPSEAFRVIDSVVGPTLDPEQASPSESLKVADAPATTLTPEQATATESLKVVDAVLGPTITPEESSLTDSLKVVDGPPTAALVAAGVLTVSAAESVKVADSPFATLNPEQATPSESLKADDSGRVELRGLGNPIRITDGPVIAVLFQGLAASLLESFEVADTVSAQRSGDLVASLTEALRLADTGEVELSRDETIRIADTVSAALSGALGASLSESCKVADAVTVFMGLGRSITESLKVADSVIVTLNPEQASAGESAKVVDEVSAARIDAGTLPVTLSESLKVAEAPAVTLTPELANVAESAKVADQLSVARADVATLLANPTESTNVADALATTLDPEQANQAESLGVVDALAATLTPEQASDQESVRVADALTITLLGPAMLVIGVTSTAQIAPPIRSTANLMPVRDTELI